jgi:DNA-binding winged helix-turn-helix (wHTH) protein/tetratricopeptide (TPR) repeat protein
MRSTQPVIFPPFRLDPINERLWRGRQAIPLRPKAFAVLCYLAEKPGQLVTKEELLQAVWPESFVTDAVLKVSIREIRQAVGDDPETPQFIETIHRRGYRFIAETAGPSDKEQSPRTAAESRGSWRFPAEQRAGRPRVSQLGGFVGREAVLVQIQEWLDKALQGSRQIVFVTGEPGIGKTTVIEAFLESVSGANNLCIARGQCLEQYGQGEAYLPVLEALGRLSRGPERDKIIPLLNRFAPTWLAQMPSLVSDAEHEGLLREMLGATRERMLREMSELVEALTDEMPLLLVLEDLHWSDYSTLDLISALARRRERGRLLLIGTYRLVEVLSSGHPLKAVKQELQVHGCCQELALDYLAEAAVAEYLAGKFPANQFPVGLARLIYQRTDGHPLFMVNLLDYWVAREWIVRRADRWELQIVLEEIGVGVPESLRQMIDKQINRLTPREQRVLEAASVAGVLFSSATVSAALEEDVLHVEELCEELARKQQFLRPAGLSEMPDGTVATRFSFIHSLYLNVLYEGLAPFRRMMLHRRIGEQMEHATATCAREMAAELALHFEQGRDYHRAVNYLRQAAETDSRRYANREAIGHLKRALDLVDRLPEAEQSGTRMRLLEQLGLVRRSMGDMKRSAEDFGELVANARQQGQVERQVRALLYLGSALFWIDREQCLGAVDQAVELSRNMEDELLRAHTRGYCGHWNLCLRGWQDQDAQACAEAVQAARKANDRALLSLHVVRFAYLQCLRSEYEGAVRTAEEGQRLALEVSDAFDYLLCHFFSAWALLHLGRWGELLQILHRGIDMAEKNGHRLWTMLFQLELAQLHEQAFDFEGAVKLCEPVLRWVREAQQETGQLFFHSLIVLGFAHLGPGQDEQAAHCFNEINRRLEREERSMDWILHLPLHLGLSRYWLARGKFEPAWQEAERVCDMAARPGERTYLALARQSLTEIALAEKNWGQAEAEISKARATVEGGGEPLAEWRVYATAAKLYKQRHQEAKAAQCLDRSSSVLNQLADSLKQEPELRQLFLARSPIIK